MVVIEVFCDGHLGVRHLGLGATALAASRLALPLPGPRRLRATVGVDHLGAARVMHELVVRDLDGSRGTRW